MTRANINNILFIFTNVSQLIHMPMLTRICKHNLNLREGSRGKCFGVGIKNSSKYVTVGRSGFKKSLANSDNVKALLRRWLTH